MVEQTPIDEPEEKPEEAPAPVDEPPPISTGIVGNGPGTLSTQGGGTGGGSRLGGKPRANNSKFGWYATQVQAKVSEAIRTHSRTRKSDMRLEIRIWSDANGRVTKATISGSTGDAGTDSAIKNEILTGMQLQEPPPADMPMPIVMRVTARRPN